MRATGRTTRKVNELVEELFVRGEVIAEDHITKGIHDDKYLRGRVLNIILSRLKNEHPVVQYTVDRSNFKITLVNPHNRRGSGNGL